MLHSLQTNGLGCGAQAIADPSGDLYELTDNNRRSGAPDASVNWCYSDGNAGITVAVSGGSVVSPEGAAFNGSDYIDNLHLCRGRACGYMFGGDVWVDKSRVGYG
jgi:hypothetical protein